MKTSYKFTCALCQEELVLVDAICRFPTNPEHPHMRCKNCSKPGWFCCVHITLQLDGKAI